MKRIAQSSYAARIGKAETLFNAVKDFSGYDPGDSGLTASALGECIDNLFAIQSAHTNSHNTFGAATKFRYDLFNSGQDSLGKVGTRVKSYTAARFGKDSDKTLSVARIIVKIRGEKPARITTESGEKT